MPKTDGIFQELCKEIGIERLVRNAPMKEYTSFRAGGSCELLIVPQDRKELAVAVKTCHSHGMPFFIMGNGSDLLVLDGGFPGVILTLREAFSKVTIPPRFEPESAGRNGSDFQSSSAFQENSCRCCGDEAASCLITAEAGALLSVVSRRCAEKGLSGLEFAGGIPGSVGGGLFMNAGAYGGELKDVIDAAEVMDFQGNIRRVEKDEMELSYRHSCFQQGGQIILSAAMRLQRGDRKVIQQRTDELNRRRSEKQPLQYPSAGSFFKRPEGYFAGKLIQDSGLSGVRVGGARISPLHAGFLINEDHATASDIIHLMKLVQNTVRDQFGVELEPEVQIIGEPLSENG